MNKSILKRLGPLFLLWFAIAAATVAIVYIYSPLAESDETLVAVEGDGIMALELALVPSRSAGIISSWRAFDEDAKRRPEGEQPKLAIPAAKTSIGWDWWFIAAYLTLMLCISALAWRAKKPRLPQWAKRPLIYLPVGAALLDVIENLGMLYLLNVDLPQTETGFAFGAVTLVVTLFATAKFLLLFAFVVVVFRTQRVDLRVLSLARFSLLMLAIGIGALFVPQWEEVLRAIGETPGHALSFWLALATLTAAVTSWYSARVMYMLKIPRMEQVSRRHTAPTLKKWLPRVLGWGVLALTGIGLGMATGWALLPMGWLAGALALYTAIVLGRHHVKWFKLHSVTASLGHSRGWLKLPPITLAVLGFLGLLNIVAFVYIWWDPMIAQDIGGAAVLLGAVGLMIPVGTWLVYWGARWDLPILLILLGLAILFSFSNDNHWVRLSPGGEVASTDDAQAASHAGAGAAFTSLQGYAEAWAQDRANALPAGATIPLFIVSAEGGGIRAAYWTAQVLAAIQDRDAAFAPHVFAISGVSGGSLGSAVFAAQIAADTPSGKFTSQADDVLKQDFLAPTLATLLFPDLSQRFLPWPVFNDRAITLERSWEDAWCLAADDSATTNACRDGNDAADPTADFDPHHAFAQPFSALWPASTSEVDANLKVPLLFLNSTTVEHGNRLIMQPLDFSADSDTFSAVFKNAIDGRAALGTQVPLSTAVHLSARFTYVSPAGSMRNRAAQPESPPTWNRLVDGGYFENSGTVTSTELFVALRHLIGDPKSSPAVKRLRPFIIHISNDPQPLAGSAKAETRGKQAPLGEVLSPLLALLEARPARGYQARDLLNQVTKDTEGSGFAHFELYKLDTELPLGWVLSCAAREDMRNQLGIAATTDPTAGCSHQSESIAQAQQLNRSLIDQVLAVLPSASAPSGSGGAEPAQGLR